jgi:hypothetical protein
MELNPYFSFTNTNLLVIDTVANSAATKSGKKYERTICRKSSKTVKIHSDLEYKIFLLAFNEKVA